MPAPTHRALSVAESLTPYTGPVAEGTGITTIRGKVMAGYQGWFMTRGDGFEPGFVHWGGVDRDPPRCTVDLWPDMSELDPDERFPTNYRYPDGTPGEVFSSTVGKTVHRHFRWMRDYGIDGVFVQRFTSCIANQGDWNYQRTCAVLNHCREGANRYGRAFAVMYDTDFDRRAVDAMTADWTRLINEMKLTTTPAYMRHRGGPVISLWGYGFGHRKFDAAAAEEFFKFLKKPENGACTIMLGVPNDWASWNDDRMRLLKRYATIISPWNVGRYGTPEGARAHAKRYFPRDLAVCRENDLDYYAVAFPGFSWTNLQNGSNPLNQIPRLGGRFFWSQIEEIRRYGMDMAYIAMFDEVDEGTAIFKCTNNPPVGRFCTYEGLPSDHYLKLTGLAGRLLRGEEVAFPEVAPDPAQMTYRPLSQLEYYRKPSPFPEAMTARWRQAFAGIPVVLHGEPYSDWVADLYNARVADFRLSSWPDMLANPAPSPLVLLAPGSEDFNAGGADVDAIAASLRRHLRNAGVILVMSGGRYPFFYPDSGKKAEQFGFRLHMTESPAGSRLVAAPEFAADLPEWTMRRGGGSRLMRASSYPDALSYRSLARIVAPNGEPNGDAVAAVQPGGEFGKGTIVYVAGDLLGYPERAKLLDAILGYVRSHGLPGGAGAQRN